MESNIRNNLAHRYTRAAAYLLDNLLLSLPLTILVLIILPFTYKGILNGDEKTIFSLVLVIGILALILGIGSFVYFFYLISKYGQTVGMKYVGIKAVKEDGSNLTMSESAIRSIAFNGMLFVAGMLQAIPFIGSILSLVGQFLTWGWCLFDKNKQNYYDKIHNVYYEASEEKTGRAKWILGITITLNLVIFLIVIGVLFYFVLNSPKNTIKPTPTFSSSSSTTVTKSYTENSDEFQKKCMETNNTKDFSNLKSYCLCSWLVESNNAIPENKKEEIRNQDCGIYRLKSETTTASMIAEEPTSNLTVNKNLYNSNYTNCLKDPNAYVEMKFTGKNANDGMKFCDCRATVVATYYTESLATQNEMLIKKCSMYTK